MPIFEYNCPQCGIIEAIVLPGEKELTICPTCKENGKRSKLTKAISASALSFKGSGFYITDYTSKNSSKSEGKAGEKKSESTATPSKTESTPKAKKSDAK